MTSTQIIEKLTNFSQPIILVLDFNSNPEQFLQKYIEKITNKTIDLTTFIDIFKLNDDNSLIKKEAVIELQRFCSFTSIENNKKFYYLPNLDNATKQAHNSLLKFIEEPINNVHGIITTSEINLIPVTIRSRCQVFYLDPDYESINLLVKENQSELTSTHWLFYLFSDIKKTEIFFRSDKYNDFKQVFDFFVGKNNENLKQVNEIFKNFSYLDIQKIIKALICLLSNKRSELIILNEQLKFNPPKALIFTKLLEILRF